MMLGAVVNMITIEYTEMTLAGMPRPVATRRYEVRLAEFSKKAGIHVMSWRHGSGQRLTCGHWPQIPVT